MNFLKFFVVISSCVIVQGTILTPISCELIKFEIDVPSEAFENYRLCSQMFERYPAEHRKKLQENLDYRFRFAWLIYSKRYGFHETKALLNQAEIEKLIPAGDWLRYVTDRASGVRNSGAFGFSNLFLKIYFIVVVSLITYMIVHTFCSCSRITWFRTKTKSPIFMS